MVFEPEVAELATVLGDHETARLLACAPGGWRDLTEAELAAVGLGLGDQKKVLVLQHLVRSSCPRLDLHTLATPEAVGTVYAAWLGASVTEVMIAIALDGRNRVIAEHEVARGGRHGMCLTSADVLRPLIRAGASAFAIVHNHPSGSPEPSPEDIEMTYALAAAADIVGVPLVDHVVVARGGGFVSMLELGLIEGKEPHHDERESRQACRRAAEGERRSARRGRRAQRRPREQ